jgi:hypothetical protein
MFDLLIVVNLVICMAAAFMQAAMLYRTRKLKTLRTVLRLIGFIACVFFICVYVYELCGGGQPGIGYVRPGLTVLFAYTLGELIYEYATH